MAERCLAVVLFAAMGGLLIADVGLREIRGVGLSGASRIAVYCFIALSMISMGLASAAAEHLRPRFLDGIVPERWEPLVQRVQEALMSAFCLIFAVVAIGVVAETRELGEVSPMLRLPIWPMQIVIPVAFAVAGLRHGLFAIFLPLKPLRRGAAEAAAEPGTQS